MTERVLDDAVLLFDACKAAQAAYTDKHARWVRAAGSTHHFTFSVRSSVYFLAIRGSDEYSDFAHTALVGSGWRWLPWSTSFHRGAMKAAKVLVKHPEIRAWLKATENPVVCGHSLGGMIALAFLKLGRKINSNLRVVSVSAAPVASRAYLGKFARDDCLASVRAEGDVVGRLPTGFIHPDESMTLLLPESPEPGGWGTNSHKISYVVDCVGARV